MEVWKDVIFEENGMLWDYRGLYQVSNLGRVKSLRYDKEKIMKPGVLDKGYLLITLCKGSKKKSFFVHRLVAFMFVDGYFDGSQIDHIDTNRQNNVFTNLRWVTHKENSNNELTRKHNSEANNGKPVAQIDKMTNEIIAIKYRFEFVEMGFHGGHISSCCTGKLKSHAGYIFRYAEQEEIEQFRE